MRVFTKRVAPNCSVAPCRRPPSHTTPSSGGGGMDPSLMMQMAKGGGGPDAQKLMWQSKKGQTVMMFIAFNPEIDTKEKALKMTE